MVTYHQVRVVGHRYVYAVTLSQLGAHLQWLAAQGESGSLVLGFDDADVSVYRQAFPLLVRYGLKATIFAIAGASGSGGHMGWAQLREMAAAGHSIQSHSWSHTFLTQCSALQLREEVRRSKQEIEDRLGQAVTAISVPGGRWNDAVLACCAAAGYHRLYTSDPPAGRREPAAAAAWPPGSGSLGWFPPLGFGWRHRTPADAASISGAVTRTGRSAPDPWAIAVIGRYMARRNTTVADLAAMAAARYSRAPRQQWRLWARRYLRTTLGDRLYHQLWRRWSGVQDDDLAGRG